MRSKKIISEGSRGGSWSYLIVIALGTLVYSNTFQNSFHLDDFPSITNNFSIRHLDDWGEVWAFWPSRFITYLSIALNYHFSRLNVFSYHLFNLMVHLGSALLVRQLVLLTFLTPGMKNERNATRAGVVALFAALLFVAHPIQTQAVTYIIQRAALLATFFYLAALIFYIRSRLAEGRGEQKISRHYLYCASLISAIFAMFSKETAISLPFMILLYEFSFLKNEGPLPWKKIAPFLALLCLIPLVMMLSHSVDIGQLKRSVEPGPGISSKDYLLTQIRVVTTYLRLLFVPIHQNVDHDYPLVRSLGSFPVLASLSLLASILLIASKLFTRYRLISFSILWFFITLMPESSILPIKDLIFEHRLYLPMGGFSIFIALSFFSFFRNRKKIAIVLLVAVVMSYSFLTYRRNFVWKDEKTLWGDAVRRSPHKARPYNNRGYASAMAGEYDRAASDYQDAIKIDPSYEEAYNNLGLTFYMKHDYENALLYYDKTIQISPENADAYNNRGLVHQNRGDHAQAMIDYSKAIALKPQYAAAYNNRALTYQDLGKYEEALADYANAIEIDPDYADVYNNRGNAYQRGGNLDLAIADYGKAIKLDPNNAAVFSNRGIALGMTGRLEEAIFDFNRVIEMKPDSGEAYNNRATAYSLKKEYSKSLEDIRMAESLGYPIQPQFLAELKKSSEKK